MYKKRISRTTAAPTISSHPQLFIRRSEIPFDKRARYVEFVCSVWNEGRFGPDLADPVIIDISERPEFEPTAFYDLCDDEHNGSNGLTPWYARDPLGRAVYQKIDAVFRRAKLMVLLANTPLGNGLTSDYQANQGRGSP